MTTIDDKTKSRGGGQTPPPLLPYLCGSRSIQGCSPSSVLGFPSMKAHGTQKRNQNLIVVDGEILVVAREKIWVTADNPRVSFLMPRRMPEYKSIIRLLLIVLIAFTSMSVSASAQSISTKSGRVLLSVQPGDRPFDVTQHAINLQDIVALNVRRDGIAALDDPKFLTAAQAKGLWSSSDRVLGLHFNGEAKAYPIRIMDGHEVVNDRVGGRPVLVTWCQLCGSGIAYDPVIRGQLYRFGVACLLYKWNLLLYDRLTESLWSQLLCAAVTGPLTGTRLSVLPAENTTWGAWKEMHPDTLIMSLVTSQLADPHGLLGSAALFVSVAGINKIYPLSELKRTRSPMPDKIGGYSVVIIFDRRSETARVEGADQVLVTSFVSSIKPLKELYPSAEIYEARHP